MKQLRLFLKDFFCTLFEKELLSWLDTTYRRGYRDGFSDATRFVVAIKNKSELQNFVYSTEHPVVGG